MNYRKIVEDWLKEYKEDKLSLEADKTLLYDMRNNVGSGVGISKEATSKTYKITSEVENLAIRILELDKRIKAKERKINMLDTALDKLDKKLLKNRKVLELRYIEQNSWNYISREVNYSYRQLQRFKSEGLDILTNILFPKQ